MTNMGIKGTSNIKIMKKSGDVQRSVLSEHKASHSYVDYSDIDFGSVDMPILREGNKKFADVLLMELDDSLVNRLKSLEGKKTFEDDILDYNIMQALHSAKLLDSDYEDRLVDNPDYADNKYDYDDEVEELDRWLEQELDNATDSQDMEDIYDAYDKEMRLVNQYYDTGLKPKITQKSRFYTVSKLGDKLLDYFEKTDAEPSGVWSPAHKIDSDTVRKSLTFSAVLQGNEFIQELTQLKDGKYLRQLVFAGGKTGYDKLPRPDTEYLRQRLQHLADNTGDFQMCAPVLFNKEKTLLYTREGKFLQISRETFDVAENYLGNQFFFISDGTDLVLMDDKNNLRLILPEAIQPVDEAIDKQMKYFYK